MYLDKGVCMYCFSTVLCTCTYFCTYEVKKKKFNIKIEEDFFFFFYLMSKKGTGIFNNTRLCCNQWAK